MNPIFGDDEEMMKKLEKVFVSIAMMTSLSRRDLMKTIKRATKTIKKRTT